MILDTAERLFAQRGVDGVALRDLAREMNLTAPSLYNHFASKQALYEAVIERGLRPVMEGVVEAWHPGTLRIEQMRSNVDRLVTHLAAHPHLARLLQRALLEEAGTVKKLILRWMTPIYREGMAVMRETAGAAGWEPEEVPYLGVGLFGMIFGYFTNAALWQTVAGRSGDVTAPRVIATQRRFLEKALYRLMGPQTKNGNDARNRRAVRSTGAPL
ncbi:MAG: TetR/AcrR family transcriptional regulator [Deltaproteobacteria bacterium]|nr:TetR/AcrR family transcriptional regulator [Deltaproteobacteria bacterium]